jgi:hypothetical protein
MLAIGGLLAIGCLPVLPGDAPVGDQQPVCGLVVVCLLAIGNVPVCPMVIGDDVVFVGALCGAVPRPHERADVRWWRVGGGTWPLRVAGGAADLAWAWLHGGSV